jgi:Mrp family chromosome partitioning ATPase
MDERLDADSSGPPDGTRSAPERPNRTDRNEPSSMQSVIAIVHQKGGVGKTTVSVCVAGELTRRGIALSLIDADKTGSARSWADPGRLQFPVVY